MTIWKYVMPHTLGRPIEMPKGAQVLHVALQGATAHIWVLVDPEAPREERNFVVVGTGWNFDSAGHRYIGTWFENWLVWHLFEVLP